MSEGLTIVVVGGTARSGNSLVGNMLGNWDDALYLPVEIRFQKFCSGAEGAPTDRIRAYVEDLATQLDHGRLRPSSLGEVHEVRGFSGGRFRRAFFEALSSVLEPTTVLRAFVHAMRISRADGEKARIAVVESPGSELLFGDIAGDNDDVRCIHMIRRLLDVYASAKAKYLRTYYPSLRHPDNLLRDIVANWRESVLRVAVNVERLGPKRILIVDFDEGKRCSSSFRKQLADFLLGGEGESRTWLGAHLDAVASGRDMRRGRFVVAENRSPVSQASSRYSHLSGWEIRLCRLYDPWFDVARSFSDRSPASARPRTPTSGGGLALELVRLVAGAAIAGPGLDRQILRLRHGLRLRILGIETAIDTMSWMARAVGTGA